MPEEKRRWQILIPPIHFHSQTTEGHFANGDVHFEGHCNRLPPVRFILCQSGGDGESALLRVLIVEDEPLIAMDLQDILEDAGHTVVGIAPAMQQALDLAAGAVPFDVAILDIDLAGSDDGIETADRLRGQHGIDALFVSARKDDEARARALGWKPIGFIAKPFMEAQILLALEKVEAKR